MELPFMNLLELQGGFNKFNIDDKCKLKLQVAI